MLVQCVLSLLHSPWAILAGGWVRCEITSSSVQQSTSTWISFLSLPAHLSPQCLYQSADWLLAKPAGVTLPPNCKGELTGSYRLSKVEQPWVEQPNPALCMLFGYQSSSQWPGYVSGNYCTLPRMSS